MGIWDGMDARVEGQTGFTRCGILYLCETDEELAQYGDQVIYQDLPDDNTDGEIPIGISVSKSKYLLTDRANAWFTIPANCQHPENAKKFLEFMLEP